MSKTDIRDAMRQLQHSDMFRRFVRNPLMRAAPLAVLCVTILAGTAQAKRLALVVGNSEYEQVYALKNASKDATDVATALERLDFEVTLLTNMSEQSFWTQLEDFANRAEVDDVESTLFYFSGHAFQLDGANYLVPVDSALTNRAAIENNTWRLDKIVKRLENRKRQTLIFLDACRNNPLPQSQRESGGEGLAKLETGSGTFVAFATQPNNVTADGAGDNSPFTEALLSSIETEGISISDMMIRVRNRVEDATYGRQTPWDQSSLRAQFYFKPVVERSASLTQADYEMIAGLDIETRKRLLAALGKAGLKVENIEVEEQLEAKVAAANPAFLIEDVSEETAARVGLPTDGGAGAANTATPVFTILPDPEETALTAQTIGMSRASGVPLNKAQLDTTATATNTGNASAGVRVANAIPADPNVGYELSRVSDDNAIVLAALSPTRSLAPIFGDRPRVEGAELSRADAAAVGIDLPDAPDLEGGSLARAVQVELARLGCYRAGIDGLWGKGSALALVRYYGNKGVGATDLAPSNALLRLLETEPKVICEVATEQKNQRIAKAKATIQKKRAAVVKKTSVSKPPKSTKKKIIRTRTVTNEAGKEEQKTIKRLNAGVFR